MLARDRLLFGTLGLNVNGSHFPGQRLQRGSHKYKDGKRERRVLSVALAVNVKPLEPCTVLGHFFEPKRSVRCARAISTLTHLLVDTNDFDHNDASTTFSLG